MLNLSLFIVKISIGFFVNSIAVLADAFNNLSDALSSVITIVGFKLSNIPADKEHPYGHGRMEYITALVIAVLVLLVGFEFSKSSIDRIRNPKDLNFQLIPFLILILSITLKFFLYSFNKSLSVKIESPALLATATDALGDIFTTIVIALSLVISNFTNFPIDGYIGLLVSIIIIYSGFSLIKDTISTLLGKTLDDDILKEIENSILGYKYITGVHDLNIHNYGPGKTLGTIHVEFPDNVSVMDIHRVIDQAEREISNKFNIDMLIHMDPITSNKKEVKMKDEIRKCLESKKEIFSIHDFRINYEDKEIIFDLIVDGDIICSPDEETTIIDETCKYVSKLYPNYNINIKLSKEFI
ncbi:MAG TPA: cation diffusion facilitator family transporter [Tissierellaceae bacterium]